MDAPPLFDFDFSFLDSERLNDECITTDELIWVFYGRKTFVADYRDTDGFTYMIGYSNRSKFISFIFEFRDEGHTVRFTNVYLSYEPEIRYRFYALR